MPNSQNGLSVLDTAPPAVAVPLIDYEVKFRFRPGDVAVILLECARRWHTEVEPLDLPGEKDEWGWAKRNVRGSDTVISNHASGSAGDFNATRHPRGVPTAARLTAAQISRCHAIRASMHDQTFGGPVVRWGGDYQNTPDAMHWEIADDVPASALARVANRIRSKWREIEDDMAAPSKEEVAAEVAKVLLSTPIAEMGYVKALLKDADGKMTLAEALNHAVGQAAGALGGGVEANRELDELRVKVDELTVLVKQLVPKEA